MNTSKLVLVTTFLTLVLVCNRFAEPGKASKNEEGVYAQIENQMSYPEFAREGTFKGTVSVEFKFDSKGKIQILEMNYSDADLKTYVAGRLSQMNIQLPEDASGKIYRVAFTFNLIS